MSTRGSARSLARSPFTGAMSHGDAIPAMQMQTCMIFAQIPLFTIISRLFPFLCHKTTMTKAGRKMPGASSLLVLRKRSRIQRGIHLDQDGPGLETPVSDQVIWHKVKPPYPNSSWLLSPLQHDRRPMSSVCSPSLVPHVTFSGLLSPLLPGAL